MKSPSISRASMIGLLAFGAVFGQDTQLADALPKLPSPSGRFGIGRVGYNWADPHRELMVYFWYPTSAKSPYARGQYLPGAQRMEEVPDIQKRMSREFGRNWTPIISGAIFSHAVEGAPVIKGSHRLPIVIFSHGLGSTGFNYTCLIEDLVSRGYVFASIEHTYIASAVWFPDGRVLPRHAENPPAGLSAEDRFKWTVTSTLESISEGAADVRLVLDRITKANNGSEPFLRIRGARLSTRSAIQGMHRSRRRNGSVAALPAYSDGAVSDRELRS